MEDGDGGEADVAQRGGGRGRVREAVEDVEAVHQPDLLRLHQPPGDPDRGRRDAGGLGDAEAALQQRAAGGAAGEVVGEAQLWR